MQALWLGSEGPKAEWLQGRGNVSGTLRQGCRAANITGQIESEGKGIPGHRVSAQKIERWVWSGPG